MEGAFTAALVDAEVMEKVKFRQPDLTDAALRSLPCGYKQRLQNAVQARSGRLLPGRCGGPLMLLLNWNHYLMSAAH